MNPFLLRLIFTALVAAVGVRLMSATAELYGSFTGPVHLLGLVIFLGAYHFAGSLISMARD